MQLKNVKYCPTCDEKTNVHQDEPWIGALCKTCMTIID